MLNGILLKQKIKEKKQNYKKISLKMSCCTHTLSNKIKGKREFTLKEIDDLIEILDLDMQEIEEIFFNTQVAKYNKKERNKL